VQIRSALEQARQRGVARLDAQLLLVHVLCTAGAAPAAQRAITRSWLLAHDEQPLTPAQAQLWQSLLARRADGLPLAYVTGEQAFCGLNLLVTPAVLIPRPETEALVHWALECLLQCPQPAPRVLDLGTGSGALALAIKQCCPRARVHATDISPGALQVAVANAQRLQLEVAFGRADWWAPPAPTAAMHAPAGAGEGVPAGPFDLVVSNPPYIAPGDDHLPALHHEPVSALVGAEDGLGDLRAIIDGSRKHLAPGGWLLLEHGHDQAPPVQ
jgi:release factor glutamine methyltransferase